MRSFALLIAVRRRDGFFNCDQVGVGSDDPEIGAAKPFAPPLTHFSNRLATDEATELRNEMTVAANREGPVASSNLDHILAWIPVLPIQGGEASGVGVSGGIC